MTQVEDASSAILRQIEDFLRNPRSAGEAVRDFGDVLQELGTFAGDAAAIGEGTEVAAAAEAAGAAVVEFSSLMILALYLLFFFGILYLLKVIAWALGHVPFVGGALETAMNAVADRELAFAIPLVEGFLAPVTGLINAFGTLVGFSMNSPNSPTKGITQAQIEQYTKPLQREINELTHVVINLDQMLQRISHATVGALETEHKWEVTLLDMVRQLQADVVTEHRRANEIAGIAGQALEQAHQAQRAVHDLASNLNMVRAVNAGLPDIQAQLDRLTNEVDRLSVGHVTVLQTHEQSLGMLAPLALLVTGGAAGLRNLRRLEDDPCLCPHLPDVPNMLGTALAAMQFAKGD